MIVFKLPFPPSVNALYRNVPGRGRVKTQRYLTWLRAAGNEVLAQAPGQPSIRGAVSIAIAVYRPDKRRRDLGNLEKAVTDLLVTYAMIDDDRHVASLLLEWRAGEGSGIEVRAWPADVVSFRAVELERRAA